MSTNQKPPMAVKPRAVLCDIDNTLYAYAPAHEQAMRALADKAKSELGIVEHAFLKAYNDARDATKKRLGRTASSHSRLLYVQQALESLGLKTQLYFTLDLEQTYWRTLLASAVLFPGVKEFLQSLRRAGIQTAAVTDLGAQIQFRKLIYFGLDDCFDYVVTSEEAGVEKPDATPFKIVLNKLGVGSHETIMIGEEAATDVIGAKKLGIVTLQKRHQGVEVFSDEQRKPDAVFDNFAELEKRFASYGWLNASARADVARSA